MDGWKTWVAAITSISYGVGFLGLYNNNWTEAMVYIVAGLSLIGIGGKLTKLNRKY